MRKIIGGTLAVLMLVTLGCSAQDETPIPSAEPTKAEKLRQAYALLYGISKKGQQVDGLTKLKKTTPAVESILEGIALANRNISAALESWAKNDTTGILTKHGLPAFEQRSRSIIERRMTLKILLSKKEKSIKLLLLAQFQALQYQSALLKVIEDASTVKERRKQAEAFAEQLNELEKRLFDQITVIGQMELNKAAEKAAAKEGKKPKKPKKDKKK